MIAFNAARTDKTVSEDVMKRVYNTFKTPYKLGAVVKNNDYFTDSPTVFEYRGEYCMYYVAINKNTLASGYETHIAKSSDLIHWEHVTNLFSRNESGRWDGKQCGGYAAFINPEYGKCNIEAVNGMYYASYLGGSLDGYETDPLYMGLAKGTDPTDAHTFQRLGEPVLRPDDADAREGETKTLYKSCMFRDALHQSGYKYVNAYNAKDMTDRERIFLAVSNDGEHWERYGERCVIDDTVKSPAVRISGDPQIIVLGDLYVMFYFRFDAGAPAYNTFACSYNLSDWRAWDGEPLIKSEFPWENVHAHKTWIAVQNSTVYHYYTAVNSENERFIALAASEKPGK